MHEYDHYPAFVCPECGYEMLEQFFTVTAWAPVTRFDETSGQPIDFGDLTYDRLTRAGMDEDTKNGACCLKCLSCEQQFVEAKRVDAPEPKDEFVDLSDFDEEMMS